VTGDLDAARKALTEAAWAFVTALEITVTGSRTRCCRNPLECFGCVVERETVDEEPYGGRWGKTVEQVVTKELRHLGARQQRGPKIEPVGHGGGSRRRETALTGSLPA
jgi:hypothetical protein